MANEVLIFAEQHEGKVSRPAWEAVAAGQQLAHDLGATAAAVVFGNEVKAAAEELATGDLAEILTVSAPELQQYAPGAFASALRTVVEARNPKLIVFSHTYQARDFTPKLAASLGRSLIGDCVGYRREGERLIFTRQIFQGKFLADVEFEGEPPWFVSFQSGAFREDSVRRRTAPARVTPIAAQLSPDSIRTKPGEPFREAKQAVDLTQAEIIVAVGRGIKAPENLDLAKKLAEALGAELGASRPICDSGWLPMDRQIGSSGQTVSPKLYLALGISGAIQHQVGMKGSRTIVAVNKDREAPIFEVATYGVVADLFEIVPPLIEEIKKAKSS